MTKPDNATDVAPPASDAPAPPRETVTATPQLRDALHFARTFFSRHQHYAELVGHLHRVAQSSAPTRNSAGALGEPLTDLERFDATNSARIIGKQGGTVPAEPWTTLVLRYEATVAALRSESQGGIVR
jgi:hypothetical protein